MAETQLASWMQDHIDRYLKSNGEDGHLWNGVPCLLLTTRGRKTHTDRLLPLIYGNYGKSYIVVGSKGGHRQHPSWYLNLSENPEVQIQVKDKKMYGICRTTTGSERAKCWEIMEAIFPTYNEYQRKTKREIPVVVIDPVD